MSDPIDMICELANCTRKDAERVYSETKDVVESVDRLFVKPVSAADKYINKNRKIQELTDEQKLLKETREILKRFDEERSTYQGQRVDEGSSVIQLPHEEMVLQNNCSQQCQLASLEEVAQTQETACPLQSEYSCDLQSSGQT
jgi:hypothetical protein